MTTPPARKPLPAETPSPANPENIPMPPPVDELVSMTLTGRHVSACIDDVLDTLGQAAIYREHALLIAMIGNRRLMVNELYTLGYTNQINPSFMLRRLVEHGLATVKTVPEDRRMKTIRLTDIGLELSAALRRKLRAHFAINPITPSKRLVR